MSDLTIRRLRLRNWKNFADVDVAIEDRVFLVGPNASGKLSSKTREGAYAYAR